MPQSLTDQVLLLLTGLFLIGQVILLIFFYQSLPQIIPTHFGPSGVADGFGDKYFLLIMVGLWIVISGFMYMVQGKAQFPQEKKAANPETAAIARKNSMVRMLMLIISMMFFYLALGTIMVALQKWEKLNPVILIVIVLMLLGVVFWNLMKVKSKT